METVTCYDRSGNKLKELCQWDVDVTIQVDGADVTAAPDFHFCQKCRDVAYVVPSTVKGSKLVVKVPNILLQSPYPLVVFLYYADKSGEHRSRYWFGIPVTPRDKPLEYVYIENIGYARWAEMQDQADKIINANANLDKSLKRADEILKWAESGVSISVDDDGAGNVSISSPLFG